ncbi:MAG TPA: prepilin-type N-terminal cleavage/methylation domain-containing protein [Solirubrobacteraceae bacterium]|nr:prepilin-type N-terminal cleavage/methylation domain-containing protein [Solirubrobacteraceae bacterium]
MSVRRVAADERGFTLIEMLVTMTLGVMVLFAILGAFEVFSTSAAVTDKATAAQDAARANVRNLVVIMRQGRVATGQTTPIPAGTPTRSDLVVAAYVSSATGPSPGAVMGWVRYCAETTGSQSSLIVGVRAGDAYLAPGTCSAGDTTNGWSHAVVLDGTLQNPTRLFDYTTSACTGAACPLPSGPEVQSVGIRLAVATKPGADETFNSVVRDAVSFRNRSSS